MTLFFSILLSQPFSQCPYMLNASRQPRDGKLSGGRAYSMLIAHLISHLHPLSHSQSKFPWLIILTPQQTKSLTILFPLKQVIQPSYRYQLIALTSTSSIFKTLFLTLLFLFFTNFYHLLLSGESLPSPSYQSYDPSSPSKVSHVLKHKN